MKIFTSGQLAELDQYTIAHEPIRSIDLMERAAKTLTRAIMEQWTTQTPVVVFAGPGNNGGDGLAMARMLAEQGYHVSVFLFNTTGKLSEDCDKNRRRLQECRKVKAFTEVVEEFDPPKLSADTLVVDALFGTGMNKPLAGGFASLVKYINQSPAFIVSVDMPSGLMTEDNSYNVRANIIKADQTLTIHQRKLAFLFPENQPFIGDLRILNIGLSEEGAERIDAHFTMLDEGDVSKCLRPRDAFAHKGSMGTAMIMAGSYGMAGASILATKACLRSGVGKVVAHIPRRNNDIMQISVPEAIIEADPDEKYFTEATDTSDADAVCIGPGLAQQESTAIALISQIRRTSVPIVLDADALNILANHRAWLQQLPAGIIMTPHPKEFDRLNGSPCTDSYERLARARSMAEQLKGYILLKGHYTALCKPDGRVVFNTTGNAGMATAGSGDVLAGIITALLARGYVQAEACSIGMFLHGLAGDLAADELGQESLTASDIINYLPQAFRRLEEWPSSVNTL